MKIKPNTPGCAKTMEQRTHLGSLLQMLVYAGLQQKGNVEEWWATCEQNHRNEWNEDSAPGTGLTPIHIPYIQPRVDMLTAQVCTVVGRQEPYMLAESLGADTDEDLLEKLLHKFWKAAGFEQQIRRASNICVNTNKVWYRIAWERNNSKPFGGLIWDTIHPKHTCIFPATLAGIEAARLIGHRFYRRRKEILALQKAGTYFDDREPTYGDTPQEYDTDGEISNAGAAPAVQGPDADDGLVELWDVLLKYEDPDKMDGEKWYRSTFAFKQCLLLSFEQYPYSRPWYFDASYITGNEDAYWPGVSVSRNLSGLQDAVNKLSAAIYNGEMMCAFPAIWGPELPQKDARYGYGEYIPTDSPLQNWSPSISFKGQGLAEMIQQLDVVGDRVARISANTQGSSQDKEATATESSIVASGVATGVEEYIANFSACLGLIAQFTTELLNRHYPEWAQVAEILGVTQQALIAPVQWDANGQTPGSTPGAKLAGIQQLAQAVQLFGPQTGVDPYSLVEMMIANLGLSADGLQISKEQMQANQMAAQQAQLNANGPTATPPNGPQASPGVQVPPSVSGQQAGAPPQAMPSPGPIGQ